MSPTKLPRRGRGSVSGRHVLLAMIAFFGVVFAVNGVLLWQALATHSGIVANEPYRKGLTYNRRITAEARQQELAWKASVVIERTGQVSVTLSDADGRPVRRLDLRGTIGRPSTDVADVQLPFAEREPGTYLAEIRGLEPGAWIADVEARSAVAPGEATPEPLYRIRRRLWLAP